MNIYLYYHMIIFIIKILICFNFKLHYKFVIFTIFSNYYLINLINQIITINQILNFNLEHYTGYTVFDTKY